MSIMRLERLEDENKRMKAALERLANVGPYETMHDIRLFAKAALTPPKRGGRS